VYFAERFACDILQITRLQNSALRKIHLIKIPQNPSSRLTRKCLKDAGASEECR